MRPEHEPLHWDRHCWDRGLDAGLLLLFLDIGDAESGTFPSRFKFPKARDRAFGQLTSASGQ